MVRIAVCDDSEIDLRILQKMLNTIVKDRDLGCEIITYLNAEELVTAFYPGLFDLVFLDIHMKGMNGIEAARQIRKVDVTVEIVFCSGSSEFLLAGYEIFALGYMLKPFEREKLAAIIDYYLQRRPATVKKCIAVSVKKRNHTIQYKDIIFVESNDKKLTFHTLAQGDISVPGQLGEIENELDDERFLRCNQSYIVNMDMIVKREDAEIILMNGQKIPLRIRERRQLVDKIKEYILSNSEAQIG